MSWRGLTTLMLAWTLCASAASGLGSSRPATNRPTGEVDRSGLWIPEITVAFRLNESTRSFFSSVQLTIVVENRGKTTVDLRKAPLILPLAVPFRLHQLGLSLPWRLVSDRAITAESGTKEATVTLTPDGFALRALLKPGDRVHANQQMIQLTQRTPTLELALRPTLPLGSLRLLAHGNKQFTPGLAIDGKRGGDGHQHGHFRLVGATNRPAHKLIRLTIDGFPIPTRRAAAIALYCLLALALLTISGLVAWKARHPLAAAQGPQTRSSSTGAPDTAPEAAHEG